MAPVRVRICKSSVLSNPPLFRPRTNRRCTSDCLGLAWYDVTYWFEDPMTAFVDPAMDDETHEGYSWICGPKLWGMNMTLDLIMRTTVLGVNALECKKRRACILKKGEKSNKRKLQTGACGLMFRTVGAASMTDGLSWRTILIFGNLLHSSIAAPPTPPRHRRSSLLDCASPNRGHRSTIHKGILRLPPGPCWCGHGRGRIQEFRAIPRSSFRARVRMDTSLRWRV